MIEAWDLQESFEVLECVFYDLCVLQFFMHAFLY